MRRSRYTIHLLGVSRPEVVLAYSAENARDFYQRKGYIVERVARGDFRIEQAVANNRGDRWRVIPVQLRKAAEEYGLRYPVVIKRNGRHGPRLGSYYLRRRPNGTLYHHIVLKSYLSPEQANRTLWHELTHARQAEARIAALPHKNPFTAWRTHPGGRGPYRQQPIEIEANEWAAKMAPVRMLTTRA